MALRTMRSAPRHVGQFWRSLAAGAGVAAFRFPLASLLIVAIAILSNLALRDVYPVAEDDLAWLLAAFYGAAAISVVMVLAMEARDVSVAVRQGASVLVALVVGAAIWVGPALAVFPPPLIVAATFAVPLAGYLSLRDAERFWVFTFWTVVGVSLAFLSVLLFVLGLSAILEMIRYLFEVGLPSDAYEHIFATAFALVGPLFALGRIPHHFDERMPAGQDERLISGLRILFDWVAVPLVLATALVLHLYAAKILVTGDVPQGEIGWIVTFFAVFVLLLRIAVDPFRTGAAAATRLFTRYFALALLVPLTLLAYAIWLRLDAQGFTLERYYLMLGALAAGLVLTLQLPGRTRGDIRWMAAVPVLLLALSAFGPWGAYDTVGRSQTAHIVERFVVDDGAGGHRLAATGRSDREAAELRSRLYVLDDVSQLERLAPLLPADLMEGKESDRRERVFAELDLSGPVGVRELRSFTANAPMVIDIAGFDRVVPERDVRQGLADGETSSTGAPLSGGVVLQLEGWEFVLRIGEAEDRFDLASAIDALPDTIYSAAPDRLPMQIVDLNGVNGRNVRLALRQIVRDGDDGAILSALLTVYYRSGEWQERPGG
uniref:Glucose-inhibited division protein A n=3 Tax=Aurantimonas manganoxydans TaxID=651183 RepID=A0A0P0Z5J0_9HYPH|nr:glucose-inhibited division protein A [Aurantimonas manganoxydans SI85-9A1]